MCHPDKAFTSDKLRCVFNEYKALPAPASAPACALLSQKVISKPLDGEGADFPSLCSSALPPSLSLITPSPFSLNDAEVDNRAQRSEDVTSYLPSPLSWWRIYISRLAWSERKGVCLLLCDVMRHLTSPGLALQSPISSVIQTGLGKVRLLCLSTYTHTHTPSPYL